MNDNTTITTAFLLRLCRSRRIAGAMLVFAATSCFAQATGKLNDTGVLLCGDLVRNDIQCSYSDTDPEGYPRQDGQMGRAPKEAVSGTAALGKTGASSAPGFDFSVVSGCTKDNITGLAWEPKVARVSLSTWNNTSKVYNNLTTANTNAPRAATSQYFWKNTGTGNGGFNGATGEASGNPPATCFGALINGTGTTCDTESYIALIRSQALCGFNDWRLPTRSELMSIVTNVKDPIFKTATAGASGANTITVNDVTDLVVGLEAFGDGMHIDARVTAINPTTKVITLSTLNLQAVTGPIKFSQAAAVDPTFFQHVLPGLYWTADNVAESNQEARGVHLGQGADGTSAKAGKMYVMLVRP